MSTQKAMTKKRLTQYRSLKREIAMLDGQILACENDDVVTDFAKDYKTGYPQIITLHGVGSHDIPKLLAKKARCVTECNAIDRFIENIDDSALRLIFTYRFIEGRKLDAVAALVGYSEKHTSRLISKYFEKMSVYVR